MSYITTPVYGPRNPVTCSPGCPTADGYKLPVYTLYDPAASPLVVVVDGVSYTGVIGAPGANEFQMYPRGTDHPDALANLGDGSAPDQVCWSGLLLLTGLDPWTRYPWYVSHNGHSDSGSGKTAPTKADEHRVEMAGCDNNSTLNVNSGADPAVIPGYHQHIKTRALADDKTSCIFMADDDGYVDTKGIFDIYWDTSTGMQTTTTAALLEYNYALTYCAMLGMLGPEDGNAEDLADYTDEYVQRTRRILWGREENRAWTRKNINKLPQFGDHEFASGDPGFDYDVSVPDALNPRWSGVGENGKGWNMWHAFHGLLQPDFTGVDTAANHWVVELGNVTLVAFDNITNSTASSASTGLNQTPPVITPIVQFLGDQQIVDVLTKIQELKNPFVCINLQFSIRYLSDLTTAVYEFQSGAQHPIGNHCPAEYKRLFTETGQTPPSLMDSPYTNGLYGTLVLYAGDHHWGQAVKWGQAAYEGNAAENFWLFQYGTVGSSVNFNGPPAGTVVAGATVVYAQEKNAGPLGNYQFHGAQFEVTADRGYARLADWNDDTKCDRTFHRGRGNSGFAAGEAPAFGVPAAVGMGV